MTNKYIIDGIDVSKCEGAKVICYDVNIVCISQYAKCEKSYCKDNKDCLYKQLQRKIHECEVWKKEVDHRADSEAALEELCTKQSLQLREVEDIVKQFCAACEEFEPEKKGKNCMYCNYNKIMEATKK